MLKILLLTVIIGVCRVLGDVAPYPPSGFRPNGALLVLPPTSYSQPQNEVPSQSFQDEKESLDGVNQRVMERLRQEVGSDTGVYYVYLPNGNLQRIQYTTAPIKQQDAQPAQQQQFGSQVSAQSLTGQYKQNDPASNRPQGSQSNFQVVLGTNKHSNQGNQQQFNQLKTERQYGPPPAPAQSLIGQYEQNEPALYRLQGSQQQFIQLNSEGQFGRPPPRPPTYGPPPPPPSEYGPPPPSAQRLTGQYEQNKSASNEQQENQQQYNRLNTEQQFGESRQDVNYQNQIQQTNSDNKLTKSGDPSQILAQYKEDRPQQNLEATSYLASVHFTEVPRITGPIYAYSPSPAVRIVRYARNF